LCKANGLPQKCIVRANVTIDLVADKPPFFERTNEANKAFVLCPLPFRLHSNVSMWPAVGHTARDCVCCPTFRHWRDRATTPIENDL